MKCVPLSRASAITCSAGSPVRKASRPSAIASPKLDAAAAGDDARRCGRPPGRCPRRTAPGRRRRAQRLAQLRERNALGRASHEADRAAAVLAERLRPLEPERLADQRVVPHLGMGVERQVVAGQRDVVVEEHAQARASSRARCERGWKSQNRPWWATTSCAPALAACSNSSQMRRDAGRHDAKLVGARDLEPVRAIVLEVLDLEQLVEVGDDLHPTASLCVGGYLESARAGYISGT